jgi:hypothetical protein
MKRMSLHTFITPQLQNFLIQKDAKILSNSILDHIIHQIKTNWKLKSCFLTHALARKLSTRTYKLSFVSEKKDIKNFNLK